MRDIDRLAQTNRWRRVPTGEKLAVTLAALATALASPSLAVQGAILAVMLALALFGAGIPPRDLARAATVPVGFILTGSLAQALQLGAPGGGFGLSLAPPQTLQLALLFFLRSLASISALLFLALSTPLTSIIQWLERRGLNPHLADMALVMFRMVWLLLDCLESGEQALKARLGHRNFRGLITSHGLLLAALLPRVLSRGRRLDSGLAARGYEGRLVFLSGEARARPLPVAISLAGFLVLYGIGFLA